MLGGTAVFLAKIAIAGIPEKTNDIYLNSPYVAGFQHYNGTEKEKYLMKDHPLTLLRQPENSHDFFAVEVYHEKYKVGYLPRSGNRIIARMMDQGIKLKTIIRSIDPDAYFSRRVKIRIYAEIG